MKILVLGPPSYNFFLRNMWDNVEFIQASEQVPEGTNWREIDLMVFTGGSDVSPHFYGEKPHAQTVPNITRDLRERAMFSLAETHDIPKVGICRGAQFLNVMNGGKLHQHIPGHLTNHEITLLMRLGDFPEQIQVTSTHHQMMIVPKAGQILAYATSRAFQGGVVEPEVVFFPKTRSLCIQYHPETMHADSLGYKYAQSLVGNLLGIEQI